MTPEEAAEIESAIVNSTKAPPGLRAVQTGKRITAASSFAHGAGPVDAAQTLSPVETTIADPSVYIGAVVSGMSFMGLALPLSTKPPGEVKRSLFGR